MPATRSRSAGAAGQMTASVDGTRVLPRCVPLRHRTGPPVRPALANAAAPAYGRRGAGRIKATVAAASTWRSGPRLALPRARGDLLHGPAVAVRVGEEDERAPGELLDFAHLDAPP